MGPPTAVTWSRGPQTTPIPATKRARTGRHLILERRRPPRQNRLRNHLQPGHRPRPDRHHPRRPRGRRRPDRHLHRRPRGRRRPDRHHHRRLRGAPMRPYRRRRHPHRRSRRRSPLRRVGSSRESSRPFPAIRSTCCSTTGARPSSADAISVSTTRSPRRFCRSVTGRSVPNWPARTRRTGWFSPGSGRSNGRLGTS